MHHDDKNTFHMQLKKHFLSGVCMFRIKLFYFLRQYSTVFQIRFRFLCQQSQQQLWEWPTLSPWKEKEAMMGIASVACHRVEQSQPLFKHGCTPPLLLLLHVWGCMGFGALSLSLCFNFSLCGCLSPQASRGGGGHVARSGSRVNCLPNEITIRHPAMYAFTFRNWAQEIEMGRLCFGTHFPQKLTCY